MAFFILRKLGRTLRLLQYFTCANSEVLASRLADQYHNLMSWLICVCYLTVCCVLFSVPDQLYGGLYTYIRVVILFCCGWQYNRRGSAIKCIICTLSFQF